MSNIDSSRKLKHSILAILVVGAFAIGLDTFVVIGALDAISSDLRISPRQAGWMVSIYAISYAAFAPTTAYLFKKVRRRIILCSALGVFILGNILCAIATDFSDIMIGRIVSAFGAGMFTPSATSIAASLVSTSRRGLALSLVFGGMTISQAFGIPLTSWIAETYDWRYSFYFVVFSGLLAFVVLYILMKFQPLSIEKTKRKTLRRLEFSLPITILLITTLLIVVSEFSVYSYISVILASTKFGNVPILPIALLGYGMGSIVGNFATAILTDRLGPTVVLLSTIIGQICFLVALVLMRNSGHAVIFLSFLWGITSYMFLIPIQHQLLSHAPSATEFALALNSSLTYTGIAIGALIGGYTLEYAGINGLTILAAAVGIVSLITAIIAMNMPPPTTTSASRDILQNNQG